MKINSSKTKTLIVNVTHKYRFITRLKLNGEVIENVKETKLLCTVLTSDVKWDKNTETILKTAYAKMELLRKLSSFAHQSKI